ncbi:2826_t:CDS:2, partial [Acaulospora colombiana]
GVGEETDALGEELSEEYITLVSFSTRTFLDHVKTLTMPSCSTFRGCKFDEEEKKMST